MSEQKFGERLRKLRKDRGLTLEQVANVCGVGKSTVRKWETGMISNMRRDKIPLLASALGVTPQELMEWDDVLQASNLYHAHTKEFPLLGEIACGDPIEAIETIDVYVEAEDDIHADFCLIAKGDSMINARIHDGDIVFIRKQPMVENGEIAAVLIDNEATLKRVYFNRKGGVLTLVAENPRYSPMVFYGEELNDIRILGKAVAFQSDL